MDLEKLRKQKQQMEESMKRGRSSSTFEYAVEKTVKPGGVNNLFRVVDPDSCVVCWRAWVLCDDGVIRPFIVEDQFGNKSPLMTLLGDKDNWYKGGILESIKDEITKGKKYIFENDFPEVVNRVAFNGDKSGTKGNWKPSQNAMIQVIDRDLKKIKNEESGEEHEVYWCKENKHTMILWLKPTPFTSYSDTIENWGGPELYDMNYKKTGSGLNTHHTLQRAGDSLPGVVLGALTEEERTYTKYDLSVVASLTSATYTLKFLSQSIAELDQILGTDALGELEKQSAMEKEEWNASNASNASTISKQEEASNPEPESAPKSNPQPTSTGTPPSTARSPRVQKQAASAPITGDTVVCKHDGCGATIPANSEICPSCNNPLMAPCDNCKKLFSVFAFKCPHCGAEYEQQV